MGELQTMFKLGSDLRNPFPDFTFLSKLLFDKGLVLLRQCNLSFLRFQLLANFRFPFRIGVTFPLLIQHLGLLTCEDWQAVQQLIPQFSEISLTVDICSALWSLPDFKVS